MIFETAKVFIAKKNTWFEEGSIVALIDDYRPEMNSGLFVGIHINEHDGCKGLDEEICTFDEFDFLDVTSPIKKL